MSLSSVSLVKVCKTNPVFYTLSYIPYLGTAVAVIVLGPSPGGLEVLQHCINRKPLVLHSCSEVGSKVTAFQSHLVAAGVWVSRPN